MRIGLSPDELLATTWCGSSRPAYALRTPALSILRGETVALVGGGAGALLDTLTEALTAAAQGPRAVLRLDGRVAAAGGALRIHAQQAARVGISVLSITDPLLTGSDGAGRSLAIADLAGLGNLGLTVLVETGEPEDAALFADRIVVVRDGAPVVAYPVVASAPRLPSDVGPVARRVRARLADAA